MWDVICNALDGQTIANKFKKVASSSWETIHLEMSDGFDLCWNQLVTLSVGVIAEVLSSCKNHCSCRTGESMKR
jgi:hypothetical protein